MAGERMTRRVWVEGLIFVAFSLISATESIRLLLYRDDKMQMDLLGPGYYLLVMSISLLITSIAYIYIFTQTRHETIAPEKVTQKGKERLFLSFLACAGYVIFIDLIGYPMATIIFFIIMFKLLGIRTWFKSILLSFVFSVVFYAVFVEFAGMIFPKPILFFL